MNNVRYIETFRAFVTTVSVIWSKPIKLSHAMSTMEPVPKMFLHYIQIYLVAFIFDTCTHKVL